MRVTTAPSGDGIWYETKRRQRTDALHLLAEDPLMYIIRVRQILVALLWLLPVLKTDWDTSCTGEPVQRENKADGSVVHCISGTRADSSCVGNSRLAG